MKIIKQLVMESILVRKNKNYWLKDKQKKNLKNKFSGCCLFFVFFSPASISHNKFGTDFFSCPWFVTIFRLRYHHFFFVHFTAFKCITNRMKEMKALFYFIIITNIQQKYIYFKYCCEYFNLLSMEKTNTLLYIHICCLH